jgi:hypothetical protein
MKGKTAVLIGSALLIVGALLPWVEFSASIFSRSMTGTQTDAGIISIVAGVVFFDYWNIE